MSYRRPVEPFRAQPGHPDIVRHQALSCTACGNKMDSSGTTDGTPAATPGDGDWAVCLRCGEVAVYVIGALGVGLREATTAELAEFSADPANVETVRDIHRFWAAGGGDR